MFTGEPARAARVPLVRERGHRQPRRRVVRRRVVLLILSGWLLSASPVLANAVPGASYAGTVANGGAIHFTVAADASRLTSYRISEVAGDTCVFVAGGDAGEWEGAAIVSNAFAYNLSGAFFLRGTFPAAQSAAGTLRFSNPAVAGVKPACDSGVLAWSASTQAAPQPVGGAPAPGPGSTQPSTAKPGLRRYRTTFVLNRPGRVRLVGRLRSLGGGCADRRRVTLKRGTRTVASATSKANGTFSFRRTRSLRGVTVRFTVAERRRAVLVCGAATSRAIRLPTR